MLPGHPALLFVASAAIIHLGLYPAWKPFGPSYDRAIAAVYMRIAPVLEEPLMTDSIETIGIEGGSLIRRIRCRTAKGDSFTTSTDYPYLDMPILLALTLASPGISWLSRGRIVAIGAALLAVTDLAHLAILIRVAYFSHGALRSGFPGPLLADSARSVLNSDVMILLPFVVWGALYLRERRRIDES